MSAIKNQGGFGKNIPIISAIVISVLIISGLTYALVSRIGVGSKSEKDDPDRLIYYDESEMQELTAEADALIPAIIGGDKDEGGCLIAAGYSWCEIKNKCLRTWEEPCLAEETKALVEDYIKDNISELSPEKEVLGGKFYVTRIRFTGENQATVDYEDGHIALVAEAKFALAGGLVTIEEFTLVDTNGYVPETEAGTEADKAGLTAQFAKKYGVAPENISVRINDSREGYFRGDVKLSPDQDAPGGYFLAKIVGGEYVIVIDGNGEIDCALVRDFPAGMADDCVKRPIE